MEGRGRPSRRPRLTARERGRGTRQSRRHRPAGLPAHAPAGREPDRGPTPRPQGWRGAPAAGHDGCPGPDPRCDRHARARTGRRGGRSPARTQRRRRAGSGGGHGGGRSGPGKRVALGAGPRSGSQNRRRRGRAREKADGGEGRGAGEAVAVEEGPRPAERRARGEGGKTEPPEASRPPEHTRGLTARGLQHQGRSRSARNGDWPRRPARSSRGLGPTTHLHGQGSPAHGAGVPRRAPGARAPPNRSREHFARGHHRPRWPEATPARRGPFRSRPVGGAARRLPRRGSTGGNGERGARLDGGSAGSREGSRGRPRARTGHQENTRGIPPPTTREGGPTTPGTPAGLSHPSASRGPGPTAGAYVRRPRRRGPPRPPSHPSACLVCSGTHVPRERARERRRPPPMPARHHRLRLGTGASGEPAARGGAEPGQGRALSPPQHATGEPRARSRTRAAPRPTTARPGVTLPRLGGGRRRPR